MPCRRQEARSLSGLSSGTQNALELQYVPPVVGLQGAHIFMRREA